jgi:hypothetical protein
MKQNPRVLKWIIILCVIHQHRVGAVKQLYIIKKTVKGQSINDWPLPYNWDIIESRVKHHNPNPNPHWDMWPDHVVYSSTTLKLRK